MKDKRQKPDGPKGSFNTWNIKDNNDLWLDSAAEGNTRNSLNLQHRRFRVVSIKSQLLHLWKRYNYNIYLDFKTVQNSIKIGMTLKQFSLKWSETRSLVSSCCLWIQDQNIPWLFRRQEKQVCMHNNKDSPPLGHQGRNDSLRIQCLRRRMTRAIKDLAFPFVYYMPQQRFVS